LSESLAPKQKAAELSPQDAVAHSNLSVTLQDLGRLDEAEASCRQAIALKPSLAEAHSNLGNTLRDLGKLDESEASCRQAIALKLGYAEAHYNLGVTLQDLGRLSEAKASHRKAIALKPDYAKAHNNLGNTLKELERLTEAEASYRKAIALKPDFADAYNNLGATLKELARLDESEASYKQAIEMRPDFAEAHYNLGNTLRDLGRHDESEASYKQAIALKPDFAEAYNNLGAALKELGRLDEAIGSFSRASALEPDSLAYWCNANLYFSRVHHQVADIEREREKYSRAIRMLESVSAKPSEDRLPVNTQSFYLAYHNFNDTKAVLVRLQCALRDAPIARSLIFHADEKPLAKKAEKKITVGICSSFLGSHTIGFLYRGLIEELAAKGLAITLLVPSESKRNDIQATIELAASKVINLSNEPLNAARRIAEANLDFLFYPDIGMSPMTYQLALSRLAPVQATSWGHPITTGLDTMDYFISSELLEAPDAQDHYSEQLIRLSKLPCIYRVPELTAIPKDRHSLGLPEHPLLIGIPQSLFKFHPDFDTVLEAVALTLPDARLILIRDKSDIVTDQLKERWRQRAPRLINQTIFLPRMKREDFLGLLDIVDFLLDPIYFGSGNTFYEAMIFGTPIVTLPGKTLSGRVVLGGYRQMRVENPPVANSIGEFVRLVVELASDSVALKRLKSILRDAASRYLWDDTQIADEFAAFVTASVDAAERGSKVPPDWQANRSLIDQ
ncbi:tetratricopeptide repeat protein, partial [Luminiphilus sp.]